MVAVAVSDVVVEKKDLHLSNYCDCPQQQIIEPRPFFFSSSIEEEESTDFWSEALNKVVLLLLRLLWLWLLFCLCLWLSVVGMGIG